MSSFEAPAVSLPAAPPDPRKHVNYTLGMVLGVDDFTQEFAYLSGRDQLLARELLGYGTVCGLRVSIEPADDGADRGANPQLRVGPGLAVTPRGQFVGVPAAQCATLRAWLASRAKEIEARVGAAATATLPLYLVLCYRDCLTDQVPIPGEPCRSEDEAFAASRVTDDFKLDLRFDPPEQREEDALRDFVQWLNQVPIAEASDGSPDSDDGFADEAAWIEAIRDAAFTSDSPPDFMYGAPPPDLRVRAEDACAFLRVAFRLWATELRPIFLGRGQTCAGAPPDEGCLLLADLAVPLVNGGLGGEVTIDEARRPYLLHLRLIQEWLICGRREAVPSDLVVAETEFGQEPFAGVSERYSRADHTHGSPALGGDVLGVAGDLIVERLRGVEVVYSADGPQPDQVLTFVASGEGESAGTWQPQDQPDLDGDVVGPHDDTVVERLRGIVVDYPDETPKPGQVLTFVAGEGRRGRWEPADVQTPALPVDGDVTGTTDATVVERLRGIVVDYPDETPKPGQVLTFVAGEGRRGQWEPADAQTTALPVSGDVTGTTDATVVERILGTPVIYRRGTPAEGQVLKFSNNAWRPAADEVGGGAAILGGDVGGAADSNRIDLLQGTSVKAEAPRPGQVLTYIEDEQGNSWRPAGGASGDAVVHPPGLPTYAIVAAGAVRADDRPDTTMYNGLIARPVGNGVIHVRFNGYQKPGGRFTYIVKALPVFDDLARRLLNNQMPTVAFDAFDDQGFLLIIFVDGKPLDNIDTLSSLRLMIEVSRYEFARG